MRNMRKKKRDEWAYSTVSDLDDTTLAVNLIKG